VATSVRFQTSGKLGVCGASVSYGKQSTPLLNVHLALFKSENFVAD
jgi:hypothetical protein